MCWAQGRRALLQLCVAQGIPADAIGFISNLVGAQAVTIVGNSTSIDRVGLFKSIESTRSDFASSIYDLADEALIKAGEFKSVAAPN